MSENSQEYIVLARKYRPQTFADLIGQEYLVQTLQNALKSNQLAHAFLLTGIRGVGKTTTARIIAKALNCENLESNNHQPCLKCSNCLAIASDNHPDVLEMDAASKTGVDDIREIITNANYSATLGKNKVFIIDEVHMLSNNAFNALLKTLEEPPSNTKFIFATTETRKIPLTILSRCQRFDLKRVNNEQLAGLLQNICEKENIKADDESLEIICNHSGGSVRDALSILDQMRLVSNNDLNAKLTRNSLGFSDLETSLNLYKALITGNREEVLKLSEEIYLSGFETKNLLNDLLEITYLISKAIVLKDNFNELKLSSDIEEKIKEFSQDLTIPRISRIWQMLLKSLQETAIASNQRQALDMILLRICHLSDDFNLEKIVTELKKKPEISLNETEVLQESIREESDISEEKKDLVESSEIQDFESFVEKFRATEPLIYNILKNNVAVKNFNSLDIELIEQIKLPGDFQKKLEEAISNIFTKKYRIIISAISNQNTMSIADKEEKIKNDNIKSFEESSDFQEIKNMFPEAKITGLK